MDIDISKGYDLADSKDYDLSNSAIIMHANVDLPWGNARGQTTPNIRHWGQRDMRKFRVYFTRCLCKRPADLTVEQHLGLILTEVQDYVPAHQNPMQKEDVALMHLRSHLNTHPGDAHALRYPGEYMQNLRHKEVSKQLHIFGHSAVRASHGLFKEPSSWLLRPFESSPFSACPEIRLFQTPPLCR